MQGCYKKALHFVTLSYCKKQLERFGVDSVVFTKVSDLEYTIDFSEIGTYERFYNITDTDETLE